MNYGTTCFATFQSDCARDLNSAKYRLYCLAFHVTLSKYNSVFKTLTRRDLHRECLGTDNEAHVTELLYKQ